MSGLQIILPSQFIIDPVLPAAGALMLIDPTHPANPWVSGVPADQSVLPNIAEAIALATIGSATGTDVRPVMLKPASFTGTAGLIERTAKGGLHGIAPQGGNAIAQSGPAVYFPIKIIQYILANPLHSYYCSLWDRPTRLSLTGYNNANTIGINGSGQQTNSYLFNYSIPSVGGANYGIRPYNGVGYGTGLNTQPASAALAPHYISTAGAGWSTNNGGTFSHALPGDGTLSGITGAYAGGAVSFGSSTTVPGIGATGVTSSTAVIDPSSTSNNKDKAGSHAFYRVYLEDLTVSGRTYAAVDALDYAEYTKQVMTSGGRYNGDTFTDPATIA